MSTTVDLIRHGEPVGGRKYRGQIDDPLSDKGWLQMRTAIAEHNPWDAIISSPLVRCSEFAREVSQKHGIPLEMDPDFMEIGFGSWEGRTPQEIQQASPGALESFWQDPIKHKPDGAEALQAFHDRIASAWERLLANHTDRHVLVVCHAGVIRMSLQFLLGMPLDHVFRIKVANAGITRVMVDQVNEQRYPQLIFHGGSL